MARKHTASKRTDLNDPGTIPRRVQPTRAARSSGTSTSNQANAGPRMSRPQRRTAGNANVAPRSDRGSRHTIKDYEGVVALLLFSEEAVSGVGADRQVTRRSRGHEYGRGAVHSNSVPNPAVGDPAFNSVEAPALRNVKHNDGQTGQNPNDQGEVIEDDLKISSIHPSHDRQIQNNTKTAQRKLSKPPSTPRKRSTFGSPEIKKLLNSARRPNRSPRQRNTKDYGSISRQANMSAPNSPSVRQQTGSSSSVVAEDTLPQLHAFSNDVLPMVEDVTTLFPAGGCINLPDFNWEATLRGKAHSGDDRDVDGGAI